MADLDKLIFDIRAAKELHRHSMATLFDLMERLAEELKEHQHLRDGKGE
jgi:hypothetical protein